MRRKKTTTTVDWLTWEGEDFPSESTNSMVFFFPEHIHFEADESYRRSLARAIQLEGIVYSLGESFRLIESATLVRAGYRTSNDDANLFIYCDDNDPDLEFDATFIEVAYVD
jgi:hypothetical protein